MKTDNIAVGVLISGKHSKTALEWLMRRVFLDHQATTPVLPQVFEAMKPYFSETSGIGKIKQ